ncbi:hypothetical protein PCANC_10306 [Puccinia coronata f. sp. avenae]|uniref:Uncharacterized protein n=1 Tax=Puccinia coronata f. sp. avenae TaxID=200324 RepID=A0A2N5VQ80_9BASI|nr:hypothetical protein PCANC_10306 [Puccinia coronata f. sp. avenae]
MSRTIISTHPHHSLFPRNLPLLRLLTRLFALPVAMYYCFHTNQSTVALRDSWLLTAHSAAVIRARAPVSGIDQPARAILWSDLVSDSGPASNSTVAVLSVVQTKLTPSGQPGLVVIAHPLWRTQNPMFVAEIFHWQILLLRGPYIVSL